jgi:enolase
MVESLLTCRKVTELATASKKSAEPALSAQERDEVRIAVASAAVATAAPASARGASKGADQAAELSDERYRGKRDIRVQLVSETR